MIFKKGKISNYISILFTSTSFLIFFYILYRSQIVHYGNQPNFYYRYYVISFILIFFSIFSFSLKKNIKINLLIILISSIFSLYLLEAIFFIKKNINFDYRTRLEVYEEMKKNYRNVALTIAPILIDAGKPIHTLGGISNRKTIHCNESGVYEIYKSDRYGFNNPEKEWTKKEISYLLVGDSFTHGDCVDEEYTISSNIRKKIDNKYGVLNLGYSGNGPLTEYATLIEYSSHINVKRIIWLYYEGNDLAELASEYNGPMLNNYLFDNNFSQKLIFRQNEIDNELENFLEKNIYEKKLEDKKNMLKDEILKFIKLYRLRTITLDRFFPSPEKPISSETLKKFSNITSLFKKYTDEKELKLYFVYLPEYSRYNSKKNNNDNFRSYKKVIEIVKSFDIPIIDINKEMFEKNDNPLSLFPHRYYWHYNKKGYKNVADIIFNKIFLIENNKID